MTRKVFSLLLAVILFLPMLFPQNVLAAGARVDDQAGLLTAEEAARLEKQAADIESQYGLDVRIVTVNSMGGSGDAESFAKSLYTERGYGTGKDGSGILFFIASSERKYALIAHGEGNSVLTDYGREKLIEKVKPDLSDNDFAAAFQGVLSTCSDYCNNYYVKGKAYDRPDLAAPLLRLVQFLLPPAIGALVVYSFAQQMKTARRQTYAFQYVKGKDIRSGKGGREGLRLIDSSDDYLYSQQAIVPLAVLTQHDDNDNFFGGGTTVDAGGFSGSSGNF